MKLPNPFLAFLGCLIMTSTAFSQSTNPIVSKWLVNNTGIKGRHYVSGNTTPISDAVFANVQSVQYSNTNVYITTNGIPAYITGPFLDGNPTVASTQNGAIFKFPLNPTQNTGTLSPTTGGNIGIFINGVALFDYRDGVSWNNTSKKVCGGPIRTCTGDGIWNRDAVRGEILGFDCAKAHPANGNYHHHQNPSAFNLDLLEISTICSTYPSDGLYVINPNQHSPLIGFAYDGFPIYGAYAYANTDGTGGIVRMKSGYQYKNITTRTNGPDVAGVYTLGYFREDYEFVAHPNDASYLDEHNGRFCITPEYPNGIYCYFATVDANHNSAYPYAVGPNFYGTKVAQKVNAVTESTTTLANTTFNSSNLKVVIYPNPAQDFIAIQSQMVEDELTVELIDILGKVVKTSKILQGSTLSVIETDTIYNGTYFVKISQGNQNQTYKVIINK
jgi:hypothetical protein